MDSPLIPHNSDDENDRSLVSFWKSIKPLQRALLFGLLVSLAVGAALGFSSTVPLLRPIGASVLQRLWDVLRFLVITTSIVVALLNSRRRPRTRRLDSGTDDSFSSKLPFGGMFYGEVQQLNSYSFNSDKEMEATEEEEIPKTKVDEDTARAASPSTDVRLQNDASAQSASTDESLRYASSARTVRDGHDDGGQVRTWSAPVMAESVRRNGTHHRDEDGPSIAEASRDRSVDLRRRGQGHTDRTRTRDDLGFIPLAEEARQSSSKINHRRGKSLEFPNMQEGGTSVPRDHVATDVHSADTREKRMSAKHKAASSTDQSLPLQAKHGNVGVVAGKPSAASKHVRSQSAYNLNELLVQQRPRTKPGTAATTTSQLSKRRNVSISCDLDRAYSKGGVPAWLSSVPSPPTPPLIYGYGGNGYGGGDAESKGEVREGDGDDRNLRKAYTESLAPWRAAPVTADISAIKQVTTESHKKPSTRKASSPPSSDEASTPSSMGSPSPSELNKKVDAFIARFHERMRLQRLESIERAKSQTKGI